ncbi:MAG: T9SS type A sorting domain-containing protein, partial [Flavisolibacter sp.]|nr:T9SS type A sorting domain-containing protein [Flavisolibacter sp.]
ASITGNNGPVCSGSNAEFYLSGTSNAVVTYSLDGGTTTRTASLSGEGTATVTISAVTSDVTLALVSVTDGTNTENLSGSSTVTVKALPVPSFTVAPTLPQPAGTAINYATEASKTNYSWTISGIPSGISDLCGYTKTGATSSSNTAAITWREEGEQTVTVNYTENGCTGASPATSTIVICYPVSITNHPTTYTEYQYTCIGPTLSVSAVYTRCVLGVNSTFSDGLAYQWYRNNSNNNSEGELIDGATNATYSPPATNGVGDYYYYAVVTRNSCSARSSVAHVKVTPAPAVPFNAVSFYTGPATAWTNGSTSSTATVTLSAQLKNASDICGDIRTAKVTFEYKNSTGGYSPISGAKNLAVNLVDPNNPSKGGAAAAVVQFSINNAFDIVTLRVVVSGNYTGVSPDANITISRPTPGGLISGGVVLCNTNSSGFIKGATLFNFIPTFSDLNFGVTYSKSLKNPQGKVALFVPSLNRRDGTVDNVLHLYTIKSNAIANLIVNAPNASFTSKASVAELVWNPSTLAFDEQLIEGNCSLILEIYDGNPDKVAITVYRNKGGLWYSNNWSTATNKTVQASICLGSLTVTGTTSATTSSSITNKMAIPEVELSEQFNVMVQSNPARSEFILHVKGSNEKVDIKVMDVQGRIIEVKNQLRVENAIRLGSTYAPGAYFAEVIQGNNRKIVKLMKQ